MAALGLGLLGCDGDVTEDDGQGGGGGGGATDCSLDAPGESFTFTVRNVGEDYLRLAYGCGATRPIVVAVGGEPLGISPGQADDCEVSCDAVYEGDGNFGCSDCGPGSGVALAPGEEDVIVWDRRVYTPHVAPEACSGNPDGNACALGTAIAADAATDGTITYCLGDPLAPEEASGACSGSDARTASFTLDLGQTGVVIELE